MNKFISIRNSLFWRISLVFLILLILIGLSYVFITAYAAQKYFSETTQKLNANVAEHMLQEVSPFVEGEVNKTALDKIMHSMMAVNPALEVYLLNNEGEILSYVVLHKKVKLRYVSLEPVKKFIADKGQKFVLGDDPRNPGKKTVFSATQVIENGKSMGYVYMILASEEYEDIAGTLWNSYLLTLGTRFFMLTLMAAFGLGLLMVWLLTRNLHKIIQTVKKFEKGDMAARIEIKSKGELANLSNTFNIMADTIVKNIDDLKKVDHLRRELIANVSHDLRTPLAVIHGYIETMMMKEGKLSEEERAKYLKTILNSSEYLKKLVADLFELSKLEARQIELKKEPFAITELLLDTSNQYNLLAQEKEIIIKPQFAQEGPIVYADLSLIERALQNLMINAIKHSPENGEVTIELTQNQQNVEVSISNGGAGISAEDIPHIFDRYYKVEKHYGANKGTGLGLAIVKNIMDVHNTFIKVKSKINEQTTFYFQLPIYQ